MSQTYYAILTAIGEAKLAKAAALGTILQLTQMAVGDGNGATPQPSRTQTALVHENRRGPLNSLTVDPANPSQIVAEHIIPEDIGGWWIREIGLYDADGDLCAVANCPDSYKPVLALPFAYLHFRSGGIAAYVFGGVMAGISFFLLNNVFGYIGNLQNWQPWLTAAAPGLIYSALSLAAFGWLVLRR